MNILSGAVPFDHPALLVETRKGARTITAIVPVAHLDPVLDVVGFACGDRMTPIREGAFTIVLVETLRPRLAEPCRARPLEPPLRDMVELSVRPCRPGDLRVELDCVTVVVL